MKKTLCLLLVTVFLLGASCASGGGEPEVFNADFTASTSEYPDFGGEEFIYAMATPYVENFKPEISTAENDAKLKKIKDTEQKLNCLITFQGRDWSYESMLFAEFASSGSTGADFTYSRSEMLYSLIDAGLVVDLNSLDSIDLSDTEKWGTEERMQMMRRGEAVYGIQTVGSMYWPQMPIYDGALISNNQAFYKLGATKPGELIENGQWTFDYFLNNIEQYGNGDDIMSLCVLSDGRPYLELSALYANGASVVYKNDSGAYTFGLDSDAASNALTFATNMRMKDNHVKYIEATSTFFSFGGGSFMLTSSWRGISTVNDYEIMNNLEDVSWWPFPYGPDADYGVSYGSHFSSGLPLTAIYSNGRDDDAGYVLNELFSPLDEYGKTGYYDFLEQNYFHNSESYEVYYNALQDSRYIYDIQLGDAYSSISTALNDIGSGAKTYTEALDAIKGIVDEKLNELNQ